MEEKPTTRLWSFEETVAAIAANLTTRLWSFEDIVAAMEAAEQPKKREPCKKQAA
jgi:hypothetical protein